MLGNVPSAKALKLLAHPKRFELLTPRFVVWCSIQLSYGCLPEAANRLRERFSKGSFRGLQAPLRKKFHFYDGEV